MLLGVGADGCWAEVVPDVAAPEGVETLAGPVLPGLVDAHSHAFQRAFAGLAERRDSAHDDFWSWRDRMYGVALRITPAQLRAIAAHLYVELLAGGYTQVCEFHYLQHDHDGSRYADPAAMSQALADAAAEAGIGLTLLPVLYERAGFTAPELRPDQRRFATSVADVLALQRAVRGPLVNAGVAVHSLRAARPESIARAGRQQRRTAAHPRRRTDRRSRRLPRRHRLPADRVARAPCAAGRAAGSWCTPRTACRPRSTRSPHAAPASSSVPAPKAISATASPTCPAGWPPACRWRSARTARSRAPGPRSCAGSNTVSVSACAGATCRAAPGVEPSTAARLFERVSAGGAAAAGFARWGLQAGARADLLVLDPRDPALRGLPADHLLDGVVFAAPARPFARVMVAGRWRALHDEGIAARFDAAMQALWAPGGTPTPPG